MLKLKIPDYQYCPFCSKKLDVKIEEGKERKFCENCNWTYYPRVTAAALALIEKDGKVLLVKRKKEPYKEGWMLPSGFVDYGEHPEEALVREVKEETGLTVDSLEFLELLQSEDDPREPGHFLFFYKVAVKEGEIINADTEENKDIQWFEINSLPYIGWKAHKEMLKKFQEN